MQHHESHGTAHQMRDMGYKVGSVTAGALGAPGILADLTGFMTGRTAEDATVLAQNLATMVSDARNTAERYEQKRIAAGIHHLGRQEA